MAHEHYHPGHIGEVDTGSRDTVVDDELSLPTDVKTTLLEKGVTYILQQELSIHP